jgi:hypothetical protein
MTVAGDPRAALQHDVDNPLRIRVLSLAGLGRSGTTLVECALADGVTMAALGEVVHLWERGLVRDELCGCGMPFGRCPFWQEVGSLAFGGWDRVDARRMAVLKARVDRVANIPRIGAPPAAAGSFRHDLEDYRWHYERIYEAATTVSGAHLVVDSSKQPSLVHALLSSQRLDVRVLHCVRDSRAVAYAWTKRVRRPEARDADGQFMTRYTPAKTARHWSIHNSAVEALRLRGAAVARLRYEDFIADPVGRVAWIQRFAGIDGAPPRVGLTRHTLEVTPQHSCSGNPLRFARGTIALRPDEDWRTGLPAADARMVTALTAPLLAHYGYPLRTAP